MSDNLDRVFLALSDKNRIKLFELIFNASKICEVEGDDFSYRGNCISYLQKHMNLSQSTISHHIALLEDAKLIISVRKGKWIHLFPVMGTLERLNEFSSNMLEVSESGQTQSETIEVSDINASGFSELVSLIANHGIKILHHNPLNTFFISMKKGIYSVALNSAQIELELISGQGSDESLLEIKNLINKYLPSIR